jgi:hypothetical protein
VEYFEKRGVSLLGVVLVRRVGRYGKAGVEYLESSFFDCMVQRYSSQDNMQVLGVLTLLLPLMKVQCPNITDIPFSQ